MNILMISHHRKHKTVARSHAMAVQLIKRGHSVTLMVIAETRKFGIVETEWDGVRVIETPNLLWGRLRSGWDLWGLINRIHYLSKDDGQYDLIHCFETRPETIYPALYFSKKKHIKIITDWNDWWGRGGIIDINRPRWYGLIFGKMETFFEEEFRAGAAGLTIISKGLEERAINLGVPKENICYIPGGTFPEKFPMRDKKECRIKVGFSLDDPIIGFSSADSHFDLEMVMASLKIVAQKYPAVKLIITGKAKNSLEKLIKSYRLENNVKLVGYLPFDELPWYLGCSDVFILPFPNKPYNIGRWPNKIGDYMCLGRPTVSNPVGDVKQLFDSSQIGYLAEWRAADIAEKIMLLIEDPETAKYFGLQARQLAETTYNWKNLIIKMEQFYERMVQG